MSEPPTLLAATCNTSVLGPSLLMEVISQPLLYSTLAFQIVRPFACRILCLSASLLLFSFAIPIWGASLLPSLLNSFHFFFFQSISCFFVFLPFWFGSCLSSLALLAPTSLVAFGLCLSTLRLALFLLCMLSLPLALSFCASLWLTLEPNFSIPFTTLKVPGQALKNCNRTQTSPVLAYPKQSLFTS